MKKYTYFFYFSSLSKAMDGIHHDPMWEVYPFVLVDYKFLGDQIF